MDFRKEETRFLNKIEANKGLEAGSSIGLVEDDSGGRPDDPGFTDIQLMKVRRGEGCCCAVAVGLWPVQAAGWECWYLVLCTVSGGAAQQCKRSSWRRLRAGVAGG